MPKRLTRKLVILLALVAALMAVSSTPTSSTNRFCQEAPIEANCPTMYWCCDRWGNCSCAP